MMARTIITGVLLALAFATAGLAQDAAGEIAGTVQDIEGCPVFGATIRVEGTDRGTKSRADGGFLIRSIPPGDYTLSVTQVGSRRWQCRVYVSAGYTLYIHPVLIAGSVDFSNIVVWRIPRYIRRNRMGSARAWRFGDTSGELCSVPSTAGSASCRPLAYVPPSRGTEPTSGISASTLYRPLGSHADR
jgi:Carboxypeptidase regulatory-like domain